MIFTGVNDELVTDLIICLLVTMETAVGLVLEALLQDLNDTSLPQLCGS